MEVLNTFSEEALLTQGFLCLIISFLQTHLLSTHAGTVTIPRHRSPSRPSKGLSGTQLLNQCDGRQNGRRGCAFDNELKGCQHQ